MPRTVAFGPAVLPESELIDDRARSLSATPLRRRRLRGFRSTGCGCSCWAYHGGPASEEAPPRRRVAPPSGHLGIYHLVSYYKIHREMAELDRRRKAPGTGLMLVILCLGWTGVAAVISYFILATTHRACRSWVVQGGSWHHGR
jgi:hypothetical protein